MPANQSPPPVLIRFVMSLSARLLWLEHAAIKGFMALLFLLVMLNVVTRYAGAPIYWVDESAIYSVVWLTFIGASAMTRMRLDFAMTLLTEHLSERAAKGAKVISTAIIVLFGLLLAWMCWTWMDPIGIAQAGFNAKDYAGRSFNFLYTERTQTLNWPTWILYLTIPVFALSIIIHGLANFMEDLGLVERVPMPDFGGAQADGVVN